MSGDLTTVKRGVAGLAALGCLGASGWLAYAELRRRAPPAQAKPAVAGTMADDRALIAQARRQLGDRSWEGAMTTLAGVASTSPAAEAAGALRAQAIMERRNRGLLLRLQRQVVDDNLTDAAATLRTLPADSVYFPEARRVLESTPR